jgi:hypothetical protein
MVKVKVKGIFPLSRYHAWFLRGRGKPNRVLSLKTCNLVLLCVLKSLLRPERQELWTADCSSRSAVHRYKWLVRATANGWVQEFTILSKENLPDGFYDSTLVWRVCEQEVC